MAFIVDLGKFGERDASMASLLKFAALVLSDCCCRFRSSTICSPTGMKVPCVRIVSAYGTVINFEAAYCCGASGFRSGIPRTPCAGGRVNSSRNSLGSGSV